MAAGDPRCTGEASRPPLRLIGGFESTYAPLSDVDCFDTTAHTQRWRDDLDDLRAAGVRDLRYPLLWHRIEREPGRYDWRATDAVLGYMRDAGLRPSSTSSTTPATRRG